MEEIRLLSKDDIDVRVAQTDVRGDTLSVNLLLYKNARIDMKILDELFTPFGWKRTHRLIDGQLFCCVDVRDPETHEWITKEDVGTESNTEAEKGRASDSFKRACVNWGIGRELYTAPKVRVQLGEREFSREQNGRIRVWTSFQVAEIGYDKKSRTVTRLVIVDKAGNVRFTYGEAQAAQAAEKPAKATKSRKDKETPAAPEKVAETAPETPAIPYAPLPQSQYWAVVRLYATGQPTKAGGNYRDEWIANTHADKDAIAAFDADVQQYRNDNFAF